MFQEKYRYVLSRQGDTAVEIVLILLLNVFFHENRTLLTQCLWPLCPRTARCYCPSRSMIVNRSNIVVAGNDEALSVSAERAQLACCLNPELILYSARRFR